MEREERSVPDETGEDKGESAGAKGDPQRDAESGVPREPAPEEERDIDPEDDPELGKETRGG